MNKLRTFISEYFFLLESFFLFCILFAKPFLLWTTSYVWIDGLAYYIVAFPLHFTCIIKDWSGGLGCVCRGGIWVDHCNITRSSNSVPTGLEVCHCLFRVQLSPLYCLCNFVRPTLFVTSRMDEQAFTGCVMFGFSIYSWLSLLEWLSFHHLLSELSIRNPYNQWLTAIAAKLIWMINLENNN